MGRCINRILFLKCIIGAPPAEVSQASILWKYGCIISSFFEVDGVTGVVVTQSPPIIQEESSIFLIGKPLVRSKTPRGLPKSKTALLERLSQVGGLNISVSEKSRQQVLAALPKPSLKGY